MNPTNDQTAPSKDENAEHDCPVYKTHKTYSAHECLACNPPTITTDGLLHEAVAASVPQLRRGKAWCIKCGREESVNAAECLRNGWPECHGQTMTIDSPEERAEQKRKR